MESNWLQHPLNDRLKLLTAVWREKLHFAREAKKEFQTVADQCRMFYKNSQDFWSNDRVRQQFIRDSSIAPKFQLVTCKAFELVALFGPLLYWRNPQRHVAARKNLPVIPDLFDPPPEMQNPMPQPGMNPQQMQQQLQQQIQQYQQQMAGQITQQQEKEHRLRMLRAELQEQVLNWLPRQQPYGGLQAHARRAVVDALVTGRGCLWTSLYEHPGSDQLLCGSFYDNVDRLLIDPDSRMPDLSDAYWIAREVVEPVWKVEQKYGWPEGSLKGNMHSHEAIAEQDGNRQASDRREQKTQDLLKYHVIYSKAGIGRRFRDNRNPETKFDHDKLLNKLDEQAGDYVMLVIADNVPCPLNLPGLKFEKMSSDEVQQAVKWPIEFWRTGGWPVRLLDFYEDDNSPWPIAPLKPAMGELIFMNVMLSAIADRAWESSRELIGVIAEHYDDVMQAMDQPNGKRVVKLDNASQPVRDLMQYLQTPQVNFDVWRMLDRVSEQMEERTGINDLMHGKMTTQDRSAEATATRREQMQLRPDDMAATVESWMTGVAGSERLALKTYVTGQSLVRLLQPYGAWVWDKLITPQDLEEFLREMDVTIEAGSTRKPNKAREVANLQEITPLLMPVLQNYMQATTDTRPIMWLINHVADAMELDMAGLQLGPAVPPPPPPQVQQQQQAGQQAEQQKMQMEMQAKQADTQAKSMQAAQKMQQSQLEHALKMREMQADAQVQQIKSQLERREAETRMATQAMEAQVKREEMMQRLAMLAAEADAKRQAAMAPTPMMQEAV